jgi:hypothetical protein
VTGPGDSSGARSPTCAGASPRDDLVEPSELYEASPTRHPLRRDHFTVNSLTIGEVPHHRLFAKLEVRDRAPAVIYAYEAGLVRPGNALNA